MHLVIMRYVKISYKNVEHLQELFDIFLYIVIVIVIVYENEIQMGIRMMNECIWFSDLYWFAVTSMICPQVHVRAVDRKLLFAEDRCVRFPIWDVPLDNNNLINDDKNCNWYLCIKDMLNIEFINDNTNFNEIYDITN